MDGLDWDGTAEAAMNHSASWENSVTSTNGFAAIINGDKLSGVQMFQQNSALFDHHQINQAISSWNLDLMMSQMNSGLIGSGNSLQEAKAGLIMAKTATAGGGGDAVESQLDCLLSASNSNTDYNKNSDHDHEASLIFSDYNGEEFRPERTVPESRIHDINNKNLWNFQPFLNNGVSSGESACNNNSLMNELDETASHNSSGAPTNRKRTTETLLISDQYQNPPKSKKPRSSEKRPNNNTPSTSSAGNTTISFQLQPDNHHSSSASTIPGEPDSEAIAQMKEMIYRAAAFRPVNFGTELLEKPKRKNVRISSDPQTVAARQRRERISERIRVLQKLVPGGSKMDTASMLDEAANYLKFLRSQVKALEALGGGGSHKNGSTNISSSINELPNHFSSIPFNHSFPVLTSQFPVHTPNYVYHHHQKI